MKEFECTTQMEHGKEQTLYMEEQWSTGTMVSWNPKFFCISDSLNLTVSHRWKCCMATRFFVVLINTKIVIVAPLLLYTFFIQELKLLQMWCIISTLFNNEMSALTFEASSNWILKVKCLYINHNPLGVYFDND